MHSTEVGGGIEDRSGGVGVEVGDWCPYGRRRRRARSRRLGARRHNDFSRRNRSSRAVVVCGRFRRIHISKRCSRPRFRLRRSSQSHPRHCVVPGAAVTRPVGMSEPIDPIPGPYPAISNTDSLCLSVFSVFSSTTAALKLRMLTITTIPFLYKAQRCVGLSTRYRARYRNSRPKNRRWVMLFT